MSDKLKFSSNLFLEKAELDRFQKFLRDNGYVFNLVNQSSLFGLIKNDIDNTFSNGKISVGTLPSLSIKQNELWAFDKEGKLIYKEEEQYPILSLTSGVWYWIAITHAFSSKEVGTVNIDSSGNITGTNTKFLEVLRGQPNFPSKIKFTNSANNTLAYEVLSVSSDTSAVLSGTSFVAETDLEYSVYGTFTPGYVVPSGDENPFQYDSCTLSFVQEVTPNERPTAYDGLTFYLARIRRTLGVIEIHDKRTDIWTLRSEYFMRNMPPSTETNPVAGIESIQFDHVSATKDKNILNFAWGFRGVTYTSDSNNNQISVVSGLGGRFKDASSTYFTDGDFIGWRVYMSDGSYSIITSSIISGGSILLQLDYMNPSLLPTELIIVPDTEEIEILCIPDSSYDNDLPTQRFIFPINEAIGKLYLLAFTDDVAGGLYNITFRYKSLDKYSAYQQLLTDSVGYYAEDQFDSDGVLIPGAVQTPYTVSPSPTGFIPVKMSPLSYFNFSLGDKRGEEVLDLSGYAGGGDITYQVGVNYQDIRIIGNVPLNSDLRLMFDESTARNGNVFYLRFQNNSISQAVSGKYIYITDSAGNVSSKINEYDQNFLKNYSDSFVPSHVSNLVIKVEFNGTSWISTRFVDGRLNEPLEDWSTQVYTDSEIYCSGGSGVITVNSNTVRYKKFGKTLFWNFYFNIDTSDTCNFIYIQLPFTIPGGSTPFSASTASPAGYVHINIPSVLADILRFTWLSPDYQIICVQTVTGTFPAVTNTEIRGQLIVNIIN